MGLGAAAVGSGLVIATLLSHSFQATSAPELPVDMSVIGTQLLSTGKKRICLAV